MKRNVCFLAFVFFLVFTGYGQRTLYTVKKGDTPKKIARDHNITVSDFYKWNGLSPDNYIIIGKEYIVEAPQIIEESQDSQEQNEPFIEEKEGEMFDGLVPKQELESIQTSEPKPKGTGVNGNHEEEKLSSSFSWVWLLLGILFGAVLGVFLFNVLYVKKIIEEQERINTELSRRNQTLYREKSSESSELSRLRLKIQGLEREKEKILNENIALGEKIDRLKAAQSNTNKTRITESHPITTSTSQVSNQQSEPSTVLYADAIIDDYFVKVRETPSEDSIFVLQLNGKNSADFEIYTNAYFKVVANPSYLDGCEKQILSETKQIEVLSKGYAQQVDANGKWKVINKLNVIIR